MVKARERTKQAYKDSIGRVLTNLRMYLDVLRPRDFDAGDLQVEVPADTAFHFCYNMFESNASEVGKILIKDIKGLNSMAGLAQTSCNLRFMFMLLQEYLEMNRVTP